MAKQSRPGAQQEKVKLKSEIGSAISAFSQVHRSEPERIWLSQIAGLLLIDDLASNDKLFDVAARVTPHLKGVAFAMIRNRENPRL